jgi:hypothetical protein
MRYSVQPTQVLRNRCNAIWRHTIHARIDVAQTKGPNTLEQHLSAMIREAVSAHVQRVHSNYVNSARHGFEKLANKLFRAVIADLAVSEIQAQRRGR